LNLDAGAGEETVETPLLARRSVATRPGKRDVQPLSEGHDFTHRRILFEDLDGATARADHHLEERSSFLVSKRVGSIHRE
jgi:hypothetical protein